MSKAETIYVAFFHNVNLGRPSNPTRIQLESAFTQTGATFAESFLASGNLVYSVENDKQARETLNLARAKLKTVCGLEEAAYLRSLPHLAKLVQTNPFAAVRADDVYEYCIMFLEPANPLPKTPIHSSRKNVEVFRFTESEAFSITRMIKGKSGYATALLEPLLKVPVTTRNWNTIIRIVQKYSQTHPNLVSGGESA